jgi:hypothetical protein
MIIKLQYFNFGYNPFKNTQPPSSTEQLRSNPITPVSSTNLQLNVPQNIPVLLVDKPSTSQANSNSSMVSKSAVKQSNFL